MCVAPPARRECELKRRGSLPVLMAARLIASVTSAVDMHAGIPCRDMYTAAGMSRGRLFLA
ncbi:hypothetical protein PF006_g32413 [Phytophthora fragariae]|uniref:Uncharacterized protein n=1 Tax=Phytophthora fragariae TaxID=53985 RepID=A0A6A3PC34_9STRA|nr:hypothetical protein PF006_g32413 [Phytophthora fragariae]